MNRETRGSERRFRPLLLLVSGALSLGTAVFVLSAVLPAGPGTLGTHSGEWPVWGGDNGGHQYSPLDQIRPQNIKQLDVAWRWTSPDASLEQLNPAWRAERNSGRPLMVNGTLYVITSMGRVAALDPATGGTRWVHDPESYKAGVPNNGGYRFRGLAYWTDGSVERLLVGTVDAKLISIDARTGRLDPIFGGGAPVDLTDGIRDAIPAITYSARVPLIAGDVVVVGSSIPDVVRDPRTLPPGDLKAFDVRSGKPLWTFHTIPRKGEYGYDTWLNGSADHNGSTNVWTHMTYDPELDYIYLPVSTPTLNFSGVDRPGQNLFAESVVCLEAKTGRRVWHFQTVHHGLWDYDLPAAPVLGDINVDGRRIKAVMQVSKQGFVYTFDRRTGEPVWPVVEQPVPIGNAPGEWYSSTQPFPTKPPAFALQGVTEENLIDLTPELRRRAREELNKSREWFDHGPLFTPPTVRGTLMMPSIFGGANFGGAAFDSATGTLFVPALNQIYIVRARASAEGAASQPARTTAPEIDGLPIFKPPYASVTAIDMNEGAIRWVAALGNGPRNHPMLRGRNVPPLGSAYNKGTVLVTKTLLFVAVSRLAGGRLVQPTARWSQWLEPGDNEKLLYIFDKETGALLREISLPGQISAVSPMTYMHQGTQYVVLAVGGGKESEIVALSVRGKQP